MGTVRAFACVFGAVLMAFTLMAAAAGDVSSSASGGNKGKPVVISHTARQARPIQLGTSGGSVVDLANGYCCSGTLGALVKDRHGVQYILSNTHVFAGDSELGGNGKMAQEGDAIGQPGFVDVACQDIPNDYVANLSDWETLVAGGTSRIDAAIARVVSGAVDPAGRILEIGAIAAEPAAAYVGQLVKKSGRTSGLTNGKVVALDATITVQYENECAGTPYTTTFNGQILVSPGKFLKAGDSGSLMVEDKAANPQPVGLLYAGSNQIAIANPIAEVLDVFGVSMVGVQGATAAGADPLADAVGKAAKVKERNAARLAAVPKALGHAVSVTKGKPVVVVLVEQALADTQAAVPATLEGVPVEVWEIGRVVAF